MTDNEIIKALECCAKEDCVGCPIVSIGYCFKVLMSSVLDLINRQQAEIERLKIESQSLRGAANSYKLHLNEAKTEAVKEFVERLKNESIQIEGYYYDIVFVTDIDDILKEMDGETK